MTCAGIITVTAADEGKAGHSDCCTLHVLCLCFLSCCHQICTTAQDHDVYRRRLDQRGLVIPDSEEKHKVGPEQDDTLLHKGNETECGSCYGAGAEDECCNTCDEVGRCHWNQS